MLLDLYYCIPRTHNVNRGLSSTTPYKVLTFLSSLPPPPIPAENLESIPDFKGLNIPTGKDGKIDPMQELFRTDYPGVTNGENSAIHIV